MMKSPLAMALRAVAPAAASTKPEQKAKTVAVLDGVADDAPAGASAYADADLRLKAAAIVQQWAETSADDLADGETLADRLLALVVGVADADKDGELDDAEQEVCTAVLDNAWDYLSAKGVSDDDCDALLNNFDVAAADRVHDLIVAALPDGEDAAGEEIDSFAFDDESDGAVFDAVYKKRIAFRAGKKVRINKRISGHVRLTAKQKISIRKMLRKSHSASATVRRMKTMRKRKAAGL